MAACKFLFPFLFLAQLTAAFGPPPYTPFDPFCKGLPRFAQNGTTVALVGVESIARALREHGGYDIMATILERNLRLTAFAFCGRDFAFFVDRRNRLTFFSAGADPTVTLFVPSDDAVRFEEWADLGYQIAMAKIDEEAFESATLSEGSKFDTAGYWTRRLVVDRVFENGTVLINQVMIKEWNIYNDGHVIVHGTDGFFNHFRGGEQPLLQYYWAIISEIDKNLMKIYEDPETGSYATRKMFINPEQLMNEEHEIVQLSSIEDIDTSHDRAPLIDVMPFDPLAHNNAGRLRRLTRRP